jgi:D-arabinitol 4-dehydrogenase
MNYVDPPIIEQTNYDRCACQPGIVHIGYGAFHRAHQAEFVDRYMEDTGDLRWGIVAVNLRQSESDAFAEMRQARDGYVLKTTSPAGLNHYRLVRPHIGYADWSADAADAEAQLDVSTVHAVTITVTESGYYLTDTGKALNLSDPVIATELAGNPPTSIYGYLARALQQRADGVGAPLTIMCCDNIRSNGTVFEACFSSYLEATGRGDLAEWVRENVTFPCSMVDRITPRTDGRLADEIGTCFPEHGTAPVRCESFRQWVLERKFAGPMPDLTKAGVEVVDGVDAYEEAKIRILNGGHSGLCYLGALAGHTTFDAAIADPVLLKHFEGWAFDNVLPGLTLRLPFDKQEYCLEVMDRFRSAAISDRLERICMDGWSKMPLYVRPTLQSCLEQGISPAFGYDCVASWYVYARRIAVGSMPIAYHEPYWDKLAPFLAPGQEEAFAQARTLWAALPETFSEFTPGIVQAIKKIEKTWPV